MRRLFLIICGITLLAMCLGVLVFWQSDRREKAFADGSVVRVEKVTYGQQEQFNLGGPVEKVKNLLTHLWRTKFSSFKLPVATSLAGTWYDMTFIHSNDPALYVYISRRKPGQGYRNVDARTAQLMDEDGCIFLPTRSGGWNEGHLPATAAGASIGPQYTVGWFRFEAFPRRERKFRFILYDEPFIMSSRGKPRSIEFTIANPAPAPKAAHWSVEPLPVTRVRDNLSFILTKATIRTNRLDLSRPGVNSAVTTAYECREDGQLSTNWQAKETELYDISGDFVSEQYGSSLFLCPRESAWKLRVKFFGSEKSRAASNAVWVLRGLVVPASGKSTPLDVSNELQGVLVKVGTFGGAGDFTYSNNLALKAAPLENPFNDNSAIAVSWPRNWGGKNSIPRPTYNLHTISPHVAIDVGDLSQDQRLTVRAVDDQGREFYGHKVYEGSDASQSGGKSDRANYLKNWYAHEGGFVILDLPADAKTVDLTFCVHTCYTEEFIFKPPSAAMASVKK